MAYSFWRGANLLMPYGGASLLGTEPVADPQRQTSLTFEQAIQQYQARYPGGATKDVYEGLFPYLQGLGFQVERPTHAGGTLPSSDKIVNSATGEVFDLISNVTPQGTGAWTFGADGYWVNGAPSAVPPGATSVLGRREGAGDTLGEAVPRIGGVDVYDAARRASQRQRARSMAGGRQSTILGGFKKASAPTTRASVLGGY